MTSSPPYAWSYLRPALLHHFSEPYPTPTSRVSLAFRPAMPSNSVALVFFFFLVSSPATSPNAVTAVAAARPVKNPEFAQEHTAMELKPSSGTGDFNQSRSVENCLPKGLPHNSAPSRYINYQPLGSSLCSPGRNDTRQPWYIYQVESISGTSFICNASRHIHLYFCTNYIYIYMHSAWAIHICKLEYTQG